MGLKIYKTINKYKKYYSYKLNEANEEELSDDEMNGEDDGGEDMAQDPTLPDENAQNNGENNNPEDQANPETGSFISDNKKAEFAKSLLTALMSAPPKSGIIPQQYMNVTTQNADEVIKFIQTLCNTDNVLNDEDDKVEGSIASELKNMGTY